MKAEHHNQLHGQPLAVQVMDLVRTWPDKAVECTLWTVVKHLAERYQLNATARGKLYHRVNTQVRTLEAAGMLVTEKKWIASKQVFTKLLRTC